MRATTSHRGVTRVHSMTRATASTSCAPPSSPAPPARPTVHRARQKWFPQRTCDGLAHHVLATARTTRFRTRARQRPSTGRSSETAATCYRGVPGARHTRVSNTVASQQKKHSGEAAGGTALRKTDGSRLRICPSWAGAPREAAPGLARAPEHLSCRACRPCRRLSRTPRGRAPSALAAGTLARTSPRSGTPSGSARSASPPGCSSRTG